MMSGRLTIVGIGPGVGDHLTRAAAEELAGADVLLGYRAYLEMLKSEELQARVEVFEIGQEVARARRAALLALSGERVALVSSGDPGIYGMAALALSELDSLAEGQPLPETKVVPGVTAASAAAALLGAPLAMDFACLSLSDRLVPWPELEARIRSLVAVDVVLAIYNPRSGSRIRPWQVAVGEIAKARPPVTPVGVVRRAMREGQAIMLTDVARLGEIEVDMETCVIVGSSRTRRVGDWMVTLRDWGSNGAGS